VFASDLILRLPHPAIPDVLLDISEHLAHLFLVALYFWRRVLDHFFQVSHSPFANLLIGEYPGINPSFFVRAIGVE
jgi:hypothetical protein